MQRWFIILSFFVCQTALGQIQTLSNCLQWFEKADKASVKASFQNEDLKLLEEKDSLDLQLIHYSVVKTTYGAQPHAYIFFNDTAVEFLSFEIYNHNEYKNFISQLKTQGFKSLGADVNGNYITTVYDNNRFLLCQDYEALENPLGKGEIPYYRYRIYRKYGRFDELNGEKTVLLSENGISYVGIRENYKNGILSGERTFYYPDGTVKRKENYQAGRLNGLVSDYNETGKLTHSVTHSYHWKYGMEKWYDGEGKVVKTLQWQRDIPVGAEKYVINGKTIQGVSYKNGLKQGVAAIPVGINWVDGFGVDRFAIPIDLDWGQAEAVTKIKALETVNFVNNIKTGKAAGISPFSSDTLYTCYYKNGVIDSVFTAYQLTSFEISDKNVPVAQTTFVNGLENGKRTFWIRSGQYKDSISYEENYVDGKLNGISTQFYSRSIDPKRDWFPYYVKVNFANGVLSGPYSHYVDSNNYQYGTYLNGKPDGKMEYSERTDQHWVKTIEYYSEGARTGEWITNSVYDSTVVTKHFSADKKHGFETKVVKGKLAEERFFVENKLEQIKIFDQEYESCVLTIEHETEEKILITETLLKRDTTRFFTYQFPNDAYSESDTLLATIGADLMDSESLNPYLDGNFSIETKEYKRTGVLLESSVQGAMFVYYKKEGITEKIEDDLLVKYSYLTEHSQPYSGIFYSPYSGENISVKNGLRHGWCIQYDEFKNEISRTKYSQGIAKKTIENTALPKVYMKY